MQDVQSATPTAPVRNVEQLMTAQQVQAMFGVDRSTIYRMAEDGRLPAVKVGRQWRFHRAAIEAVLHPTVPVRVEAEPAPALQSAIDVAAELLGVMMIVTDMDGRPLTAAANQCRRFATADAAQLEACAREWKAFADEYDVTPRFRVGALDFECARAFIRSDNRLVAMVLAGGIAAPGDTSNDLHVLDTRRRSAVLEALPRVAAALSQSARRLTSSLAVPTELRSSE